MGPGYFGAVGVPFRTRRNLNTHPWGHTKSGSDLEVSVGRRWTERERAQKVSCEPDRRTGGALPAGSIARHRAGPRPTETHSGRLRRREKADRTDPSPAQASRRARHPAPGPVPALRGRSTAARCGRRLGSAAAVAAPNGNPFGWGSAAAPEGHRAQATTPVSPDGAHSPGETHPCYSLLPSSTRRFVERAGCGLMFSLAAGRGRKAPETQHADVAQLVAHHLAKVRVAGSNPVIRSKANPALVGGVAEW